jgi:hypothetical protein
LVAHHSRSRDADGVVLPSRRHGTSLAHRPRTAAPSSLRHICVAHLRGARPPNGVISVVGTAIVDAPPRFFSAHGDRAGTARGTRAPACPLRHG